ncbi:MAG: thiamine pyrophosphate-binding protein [Chloroflexota bacterium]|nr:thiamine pyrophosphate-binding protein [Chloroflexota bacterium]
MAETWGGDLVAQVLAEGGVEYAFGIHGGHVWSLMAGMDRHGIRQVHPFRHEQSAGYAADGYARAARKVGVCFVTAGPGATNIVSAISQAYLCRSPVVALMGQHTPIYDGRGPLQEAYGAELCNGIAKWTRRVVNIDSLYFNVKRALTDAMAYPPGPVVLDLPWNVMWARAEEAAQEGYALGAFQVAPSRPGADPAAVERAVRMLLQAERPVIIGGDGLYWSDASAELKELAELLQVPVQTRRMGRGALPEAHPLAFRGPGTRGKLLGSADIAVVMGMLVNHLEGYGNAPTDILNPGPWNRETRFIQVGEAIEEFNIGLPTELAIMGSPRLVLKQMIDCARDMAKQPVRREQWIRQLAEAKQAAAGTMAEEAERARKEEPIHPRLMAQEILSALDSSTTLILDGFTISSYASDQLVAGFAGQVMDAGTQTGVGHGVGMGIGVQLARPGKPVVVLIGDGGMGLAGMDIETAARLNLPICFVLDNNSRWMGYLWDNFFRHWGNECWGMTPDIRYDLMFEQVGCHTEFVTSEAEIRPAMERALGSGKTSVVNIIRHTQVCNPWVARSGALIVGADGMKALPQEAIQTLFAGITEDAYPTVEAVLRTRVHYAL